MKLKQLQEKRGSLMKQVRETLDTAGKESRALTADEQTTLAGLESEISGIDSTIELEMRQIQREAQSQGAAPETTQERDDSLGLNSKEVRQYSLLKVLRSLADRKPLDGLEKEASEAEARRLGRDPSGVFVPAEVFALGAEQRNIHRVGNAADGGYLVDTSIDYANMVELLRNQSHVMSLGARTITGLRGDISIPRVISGTTAYWVSETGAITDSKAQFGQLQAKPRRLGSTTQYTKQLLVQTAFGVEAFVRDDIMASFGTELDRVAINGAGAAEPLGIFNLAAGDRATGVTFGAAPTWGKVVEFETNVETANALALPGSRYAYLTTPGVKGKWKTTPKVANQAVWLWENGDLVNGYSARSTNQVPANKVIFGDFSQVLFFEWTGIDLVVDPYTLATQNQVKVTMQKHVDCIIRQGKAFSVSSDAGNQ
jgi:HK97 family phage major capsid protein